MSELCELKKSVQLVHDDFWRCRRVSHDGVDPSQLLKERNHKANDEVGPVARLKQLDQWVLHQSVLSCVQQDVLEL